MATQLDIPVLESADGASIGAQLKPIVINLGFGAEKPQAGGWPDLSGLCTMLADMLCEECQSKTVSNLAGETLVAIDRAIGQQMSVVMTHPLFIRLEAAWRGLETLVLAHQQYYPNAVGSECEIKVVDCSVSELCADLASDEKIISSWLYDSLYTQRLDTSGGKPFGILIGGMEFGSIPAYSNLHDPESGFEPDQCSIRLLHRIARVAESALCPFIAAAGPQLFDFADFSNIPDGDGLTISSRASSGFRKTGNPPDQDWGALRKDPASRFVGLVVPRVVLAPSLSRRGGPVDWFTWPVVSSSDPSDSRTIEQRRELARLAFKPLLGSAAYALAGIVLRSVCNTGWASGIFGVGSIEAGVDEFGQEYDGGLEEAGGLLLLKGASFNTDPEGACVRSPVEVSLTGEQERRLGCLGFLALSRVSHTNRAAFYSLRMAHQPELGNNAAENATQEMHSILPYILTGARFAQFAKVCIRREHGGFNSAEEVRIRLNNILGDSFLGDGRPLAAMEVKVVDLGNGTYACSILISPRLMAEDVQVNGMIALRLVVAGRLITTTEVESAGS